MHRADSLGVFYESDNVWTDYHSKSDSESDLEVDGRAREDRQYTLSLRFGQVA
jgi:hypothetical protein